MKKLTECPNTHMTLVAHPPEHDWSVALLYRPACKKWACPYCAERLRVAWGQRVYHGIVVGTKFWGWEASFVTLTSHERLSTFQATATVWPKVWAKFSARLRRAYAGLEYVSVPEKHKNGRLHVHLVMSVCPKKRWLKDNLRESGGGHQADVTAIKDGAKAAWYVTKYLAKQMTEHDEWAGVKMRRINTSRGWPDQPPETAFDVPFVEWSLAAKDGDGQNVIDHYQALGRRVILIGGWGEVKNLHDARNAEKPRLSDLQRELPF